MLDGILTITDMLMLYLYPQLTRRAAIKVKRGKTVSASQELSSSGSYSSLIRARAQQVREASKSPTPTPQDFQEIHDEGESHVAQCSELVLIHGAAGRKYS